MLKPIVTFPVRRTLLRESVLSRLGVCAAILLFLWLLVLWALR